MLGDRARQGNARRSLGRLDLRQAKSRAYPSGGAAETPRGAHECLDRSRRPEQPAGGPGGRLRSIWHRGGTGTANPDTAEPCLAMTTEDDYWHRQPLACPVSSGIGVRNGRNAQPALASCSCRSTPEAPTGHAPGYCHGPRFRRSDARRATGLLGCLHVPILRGSGSAWWSQAAPRWLGSALLTQPRGLVVGTATGDALYRRGALDVARGRDCRWTGWRGRRSPLAAGRGPPRR